MAALLMAPDGTIMAVNDWLSDLVGYGPGELVGLNALDLVHPDDAERAATNLVDAAGRETPAALRMAVRIEHLSSGEWLDLLCVAVNLLGQDGFDGLLVSVRPTATSGSPDPRRRGWFEAVVSGTNDIVQVVDEDGRFLWASGPVERLHGFPADAMVGLTIEQVRNPEQPDDFRRWFEYLKHTPGVGPVTIGRRRMFNGEQIDLEVRANNLLDDPEVGAIVLTTRDISERATAERARQFAADVLARAPVAFVTTDRDGMITSFNPEVERVTGWTAAEAIGRRFRDLGGHTPTSLQTIVANMQDISRGGTIEFETEILTKSGELAPIYLGVTGMLDHEGGHVGLMIFGLDLREQTATRRALDRTEARWTTLARHGHELVVLLEPDGTIQWAGSTFESLLGHDAELLVGTSIRDLIHPDDRGRPGGLTDLAAGRGGGYAREYRLRDADGGWRVFDVTVTDLRDDPAIGALLATGRDITDRVETESDNRRMAAAIESAGAAVVLTDREHRIVSWNKEAERLSGQRAEDVIGLQLDHDTLAERSLPEVLEGLEAGATITYDTEQTLRDGGRLTLAVTASPVTDAAGAITGYSFISFDITAQREAAREREATAAQSRALAELGQRALSGASVPDILEDAAELAAAAMDIPHVHVLLISDDHRQHEVAAAVGMFAPDIGTRQPAVDRAWTEIIDDQRRPVVVTDFNGSDSVPRPVALEDTSVRSGVLCGIDGRDGPIGYLVALDDRPRPFADAEVAFLQSIANVLATAIERRRVSDEMQRRALHDELTGLPNRALLLDRLSQAVGRLERHEGLVGLLFIDLDRFKRVNDTLGHQAGDVVLVATAQRLLDAVRAGDTVARTGGDEFLVLTEELADPIGAVTLGERIAAALAAPVFVDGHGIHVTASIGVAIATHTSDPEELVRDADLAMYRAKQDGRDRIQVFDASMHDEAVTGMAMEEALRSAVSNKALEVVFQPQVRMADGAMVGFEALARWDHPRLGAVPPSSFVGVAEEIGVLDDITRAVLAATCQTAAELRRTHPQVIAGVNLTPRQMGRRRVLDLIDEALEQSALPPSALVVELTETSALDDLDSLKILTELRGRGVRVSVDDFGTGYSSLTRVTHLPADEVKIDRSFVTEIASDRGCAAVVSAIVTLATVLKLRIVAEGVETELQRQALLDLGCTDGQGWLFSGPLDHDGLLAWAAAH